MKKYITAAILLVLSPFATAVTASISLTNIQVQVIDLDPTDGVNATLIGDSTFPAFSSGEGNIIGSGFSGSGSSQNTDERFIWNSNSSYGTDRTLTPHSELIVQAQSTINFDLQNTCEVPTFYSGITGCSSGGALSYIMIGTKAIGQTNFQTVWKEDIYQLSDVSSDLTNGQVSGSKLLSVAIFNNSDSYLDINHILFVADITGNSPMTKVYVPIPEPSTYLMMVSGLGLLGWRKRRS